MGKYGQSWLLEWYSDWHFHRCREILPEARSFSMTDFDAVWLPGGIQLYRWWIEVGRQGVLGIFDIMEDGKEITVSQNIAYGDVVQNWKKPVYLVYPQNAHRIPPTSKENCLCDGFSVQKWRNKQSRIFTELEYAQWLCEFRQRRMYCKLPVSSSQLLLFRKGTTEEELNFMSWLNNTDPGVKGGVITVQETQGFVLAVLKVNERKVATSYIKKDEIAGREPKQFAMEKAKELVEWYKSIKETDNGR